MDVTGEQIERLKYLLRRGEFNQSLEYLLQRKVTEEETAEVEALLKKFGLSEPDE